MWEIREDVGRMKLCPRGGVDVGQIVDATSETHFLVYMRKMQ